MSGPVSPGDAPVADDRPTAEPPVFERFESRVADVGGVKVRRALPKRQRRTIGAWCFVDHFGPAVAPADPLMQVGPHPHIGLQTVTWLLHGEVLHRDSLGSEQLIRPGGLNLMTGGHGVVHAEETQPGGPGVEHGAQLWVAQPEATRHGPAAFEHHADLPQAELDGLAVTVLLGEVAGMRSPARTDTPLAGAAITGTGARSAGKTTAVPLNPAFEYGVVVLEGNVMVDGRPVVPGELVYLGRGRHELPVAAGPSTHALLLGGEPFPEPVLMWWNFLARTREELAQARQDWESGAERFGPTASSLPRIPAPAAL
ncbi:MAG TPA: pirin family protein [Acidimicrobiales bacterium]|jgi:redox-sensitive bicupin YhaK (pirin superfamily)|nr:pirin family protein [Acidimicrobiales bacterium]